MWRYVFFYMLVLSSTDFYCLSSLSCPRNHSLQTMNHPQGLLMLKLKTGRIVSDNSLDTLKCSHCKGKATSYQAKTPLTSLSTRRCCSRCLSVVYSMAVAILWRCCVLLCFLCEGVQVWLRVQRWGWPVSTQLCAFSGPDSSCKSNGGGALNVYLKGQAWAHWNNQVVRELPHVPTYSSKFTLLWI